MLVAVAWGPLLVVALSARVMIGHAFAIDWGVHARLLVAIPLLLLADASLHERTRFVVDQLVADRWVTSQQERFDGIVAQAVRHRDAVVPEVLLLGIALAASQVVVWDFGGVPFVATSGDDGPASGRRALVVRAGGVADVSVSRLPRAVAVGNLDPDALAVVAPAPAARRRRIPTWRAGSRSCRGHPSGSAHVIAALSATQAGVWADQVLYAGLKVTDAEMASAGVRPRRAGRGAGPAAGRVRDASGGARSTASIEYGSLAIDYTRLFQARWIARRERDDVLGSADIQSLADLGNGYDVVDQDAFRAVRPARGDRRSPPRRWCRWFRSRCSGCRWTELLARSWPARCCGKPG